MLLFLLLLFAFAAWITTHVLLCMSIGRHSWGWAMSAFLMPPLAPFFGLRLQVGTRRGSFVWLGVGSVYLILLAVNL